ncbi:MAG: TadE family protein [Erythrobacter sp.]
MIKRIFTSLRRDTDGAAVIEFAIVAPAVIGMMLGVLQIGLSMQAQNALRGIASDTARYAVVEYMKKNEVTNTVIKDEAEAIGESAPYLLQDSFTATVVDAGTQRVDGAFEKTLTLTYTPPNVLPLFEFASQEMTFSRPIFLIDE